MNDEFYKSVWWRKERKRVLENWDGRCERCGKKANVPHVHHVFGIEKRAYAIFCPDCHAKHHGRPNIATYRGAYRKCEYCGEEFVWRKVKGRWKPIEPSTNTKHCCQYDLFI